MFVSNSNQQIDIALKLEKSGERAKALEILINAIKSDPSCKACRGHMGRIANDLNNEKKLSIIQ